MSEGFCVLRMSNVMTAGKNAIQEEGVSSLDLKDDTWAEGIVMDRPSQHEGMLFDIDLRAEG